MDSSFIFFHPDAKGGVETFTKNYAQVIKGSKIKIIKYKVTESIFTEVSSSLVNNIEELSIGFSKYATPRSKFAFLRRFIGIMDVLICNDSFELEFINYFKLRNKAIYILHGDLNHYRNILNSYQSFIDTVLCVSNGLRNKYGPLFPCLKFGVSHPFLPNIPERKPLIREKLNAIFIGKFEYQKGADLFINLVNSCNFEMNWTVASITEGSEADLFNRIPSYVKIYKDLPNEKVLELLGEMDILIFPSRTEGFGIAVLEAMSEAVIPIVLNIPIGIPDQVIDGYNGFIVDEQDWDRVNACLEKLNSSNVLTDMKRNAVDFVKTNFNSMTIAEDFVGQVSAAPVSRAKRFFRQTTPRLARLPEPVYRILKFAHCKIKYG